MSHLRLIAATCIATSVVALPAVVFAQTVTELQSELQSLLAEIAQLQQGTSSTQPATVTTTSTSASAVSSNIICPTLIRTLSLGSSGTDVANLQGFLAQNPLIYPEQSVTGYFSKLTQDAVQRWQTAYGVISSGTPASTGYGVVGPHTRAAILSSCKDSVGNSSGSENGAFVGSGSSSQPLCPVAPQPATPCAGTWSPLTNTTGCTIAWQCSISLSVATSSAASPVTPTPTLTAATGLNSPFVEIFSGVNFPTGIYTIYYGDGVSETVTAVCPSGMSNQASSATCGIFSASHVYMSQGTYSASTVSSSGTAVGTVTVVVGVAS